nr:hypothetical protein Iba_chr13bCG16290 [Ipomoea batatas]
MESSSKMIPQHGRMGGGMESSQSMSFRTWAENLKNKAGEDSGLVKAIDEAKREVDYFFQLAFKELGKEIYEECTDGLVKKANEIFVSKLVREGKEIDSRLKKELGWIDKDSSATKKSESEGSSNASSKKKGRVIKTSNDWVGVAEEFMRQDKGFESKVEEALKAVNDYLWTVFDKEKNAYLEEKKIRAVRAAVIFLDIVKDSPVWGAENELLGRILKANQTLLIWLAVLKLLTDEQKGVIKLAVINEAHLAHLAEEIIYEAAMGHIETLAEVVMQEGDDGHDSASPCISYSVWAKEMKEKLGSEKGKQIDEAKDEVMEFFVKAHREFGQLKYDEMEPQLLEKAAIMFENKIKKIEGSPVTPNIERIAEIGKVNSVVEKQRKKVFDVEEWAQELNKLWEEDEEMWSVMDDMFEELKKFLETHGGGIKKYDIKMGQGRRLRSFGGKLSRVR